MLSEGRNLEHQGRGRRAPEKKSGSLSDAPYLGTARARKEIGGILRDEAAQEGVAVLCPPGHERNIRMRIGFEDERRARSDAPYLKRRAARKEIGGSLRDEAAQEGVAVLFPPGHERNIRMRIGFEDERRAWSDAPYLKRWG